MSSFIAENFSSLFLSNAGADTNCKAPSTELPATNSEPYELLSAELWLSIFGNLERNDLDSCEHVCAWWHQMIRHNSKYLARRVIDYVIFSSKRTFSMMLSSGSIIKVYRTDKYFTSRNMLKPIGDSSFMTVETYRRSQSKPKPSADGGAQLSLYFEELRAFTNEAWESDDRKSGILGGVDAIGLHYPHFYAKTFYKILTPPNAFFFKLNKLLRNLSHVNYWVFQTFTLTDAFVEQFMHCVEPKIITNDIRLIRVKRGKAHDRAVRFFFNVVLGNRQILEKLPNATNVMMLNTD